MKYIDLALKAGILLALCCQLYLSRILVEELKYTIASNSSRINYSSIVTDRVTIVDGKYDITEKGE